MAIYATNDSKPRELIAAGNYPARCYQMIHIGTVLETFKGDNKLMDKVRIGWELPGLLKSFTEGAAKEPVIISQEYTLSMNEKSNLRKMLASWRGKDFTEEEAKSFDITKLLGIACLLNIIHTPGTRDPTKIYEKIGSVSSVPRELTVPPAINRFVCLSYDNWDEAVYNSLPDFLKDKIKTSIEYTAMRQPNVTHLKETNEHLGEPDDLPF